MLMLREKRLLNDQRGQLDPLLIPLITTSLFAVAVAIFGLWAYLQYTTERDNTDEAVAIAVAAAEAAQKETLEADFAERSKSPFRSYVSDSSIGSIDIEYPDTWSAYVDEKIGTSSPLNGFFHPSVVSADDTTRHALRILVDESDYARGVAAFEDSTTDGSVTAKPLTVAGVTGVRVDGQIDKDFQGAMVILALRDKTVRVWTESTAYLSDFNGIVERLTFEK